MDKRLNISMRLLCGVYMDICGDNHLGNLHKFLHVVTLLCVYRYLSRNHRPVSPCHFNSAYLVPCAFCFEISGQYSSVRYLMA
jgi:hypothetical protein